MTASAVMLRGPGAFVVDEIPRSSEPQRAAVEIALRANAEGLAWVALQIHPGDEHQPSNAPWAPVLKAALATYAPGCMFGTWAQNLPPAAEILAAKGYGATFHIPNVETAAQAQLWNEGALDQLIALKLPNGYGVAFSEGAWGRDATLARPWVERGFVAMPEAEMTKNPSATIEEMRFLAHQLGQRADGQTGPWQHGRKVAPVVYLVDPGPEGKRATIYDSSTLALCEGAWSVWRYGGVAAADWALMRTWPKPAASPPPPDPPASPEGISNAEAYRRIIEAVDLVDARLEQAGQPRLGPAAALYSARRLATAAQARVWTVSRGNRTAQFLDELGIE